MLAAFFIDACVFYFIPPILIVNRTKLQAGNLVKSIQQTCQLITWHKRESSIVELYGGTTNFMFKKLFKFWFKLILNKSYAMWHLIQNFRSEDLVLIKKLWGSKRGAHEFSFWNSEKNSHAFFLSLSLISLCILST